jgi:hypothetical protein
MLDFLVSFAGPRGVRAPAEEESPISEEESPISEGSPPPSPPNPNLVRVLPECITSVGAVKSVDGDAIRQHLQAAYDGCNPSFTALQRATLHAALMAFQSTPPPPPREDWHNSEEDM